MSAPLNARPMPIPPGARPTGQGAPQQAMPAQGPMPPHPAPAQHIAPLPVASPPIATMAPPPAAPMQAAPQVPTPYVHTAQAQAAQMQAIKPPTLTADIRRSLAKRLSDVICIPGSQLPPQERNMAGDILVEMLRDADESLRESVAKRLVMLNEAPRTILVILAKDNIDVARHVLEESKSLTDSDLIQIARKVTTEHRTIIAKRRHVSDAVVDTLVEFLEEPVVETLLANKGAGFSETALQRILAVSRNHRAYVDLLADRVELRPSHGLSMFWWADAKARKKILKRFGVTRNVLQESCADIFPKAAQDGWSDPAVRKALQFIERRQRNRAAIERSHFEGLEQAIDTAEAEGLTRPVTEEISYMSGVKPATGAQILTDKGGEGVAILCKAPGLKREYLAKYWRALRRPTHDEHGKDHPDFARIVSVYDSISTDKAQTILRYWNWSLTSALNEDVMRYIKQGMLPKEEDFGAAAITAALVFGQRDD
ncbi:MAG: DUF2336 domain-containing protein [Maricaulaceae bacterium]